jgi:hypothetical protein
MVVRMPDEESRSAQVRWPRLSAEGVAGLLIAILAWVTPVTWGFRIVGLIAACALATDLVSRLLWPVVARICLAVSVSVALAVILMPQAYKDYRREVDPVVPASPPARYAVPLAPPTPSAIPSVPAPSISGPPTALEAPNIQAPQPAPLLAARKEVIRTIYPVPSSVTLDSRGHQRSFLSLLPDELAHPYQTHTEQQAYLETHYYLDKWLAVSGNIADITVDGGVTLSHSWPTIGVILDFPVKWKTRLLSLQK